MPTDSPSDHDALARALTEYREILASRRTQAYQNAQAELAEDKERLARARAFADQTGLSYALIALLEEVRYYPAWMKRGEEFAKYFLAGFSDIEGTSDLKQADVSLTFGGVRFHLRFQDTGSFESASFANLSLEADGQPVLGMALIRDSTDEFPVWECHNVTALEAGPWATTLLDLEHAIRTKQDTHHAELMASLVHEPAKNLPQLKDLPPVPK